MEQEHLINHAVEVVDQEDLKTLKNIVRLIPPDKKVSKVFSKWDKMEQEHLINHAVEAVDQEDQKTLKNIVRLIPSDKKVSEVLSKWDKMEQEHLINHAVEAVDQEDLKTLKNIVRLIPPDKKVSVVLSKWDKMGRTPLNKAIAKKNLPIMRFLLEDCHVNPMVRNEPGLCPLAISAINGDFEIIKMLIESGANLNEFDGYYWSPLNIACQRGDVKIARYLVEKGGDINKSKCLINAVKSNDNEFMKYLLECGADVNVKNAYGDTPLHVCGKKGNMEIFKILIKKGATICENHHGVNQLQVAALGGHEDIIAFYSENGVHNRDEILDCFELLGLKSFFNDNLPLSINFWKTVIKERSRFDEPTFLGNLRRNSLKNQNFDHWIEDIENASIHSMIILERIFGFKHWIIEKYFKRLLKLISIQNIEFWKGMLDNYLEPFDCDLRRKCKQIFTFRCKDYIKCLNPQNINSSILNVIIRFINLNLNDDVVEKDHPRYIYKDFEAIILIVCLNCIKEKAVDFNLEWFNTNMKNFLNSGYYTSHNIFHILIKFSEEWDIPERIIKTTFEMLCRISNGSMNNLDIKNNTPLHTALYSNNDKFIEILLQKGALLDPDARNSNGRSIRDLAAWYERKDICIGPASFQALINIKIKQDSIETKKHFNVVHTPMRKPSFHLKERLPSVLEHFMKFH